MLIRLVCLFLCLISSYGQKTIEVGLKKVYSKSPPRVNLELLKTHNKSRGMYPITKDQINFGNLQYVGTLYVGTQRQELDFIFDTGSTQLWVPLDGCVGCGDSTKYIPTDEYEETGVTDYISYVKGYVQGEVFTDVVRFTQKGFPCRIKMLGVTYGEDNEGMAADGILGLSPRERGNDELLVEKLYNTKTIEINAFGVSYLFENEDSKIVFGGWDKSIVPSLANFTWFDLVNTDYWSLEITGVYYNGIDLDAVESIGVLDTGTSLVYFNHETFTQMWNDIKSKHEDCELYSGWYLCGCENGPEEFEDIIIQISGVNVTFPGESYVEYYEGNGIYDSTCYLHIDSTLGWGGFEDEILIGDAFLRNYYIYHDVGNARAGFFNADIPIVTPEGRNRNLELEKAHAYFESPTSKSFLNLFSIIPTLIFIVVLMNI